MSVEFEARGDIAILRLKGEFYGGKETDELDAKIKELQDSGNRKLVLNLSKARHMTTLPLGSLIKAHINYTKRGAQVRLCGVNDRIHHVLVVTRLILVFGDDYQQTEEEAIASFAQRSSSGPEPQPMDQEAEPERGRESGSPIGTRF